MGCSKLHTNTLNKRQKYEIKITTNLTSTFGRIKSSINFKMSSTIISQTSFANPLFFAFPGHNYKLVLRCS